MSDDLYCPICSELMFDPVVLTPCGHSFDRGCVENWFKTKSYRSCPSCREIVQNIFPNITLKNLVHEHAKNNNISIPPPRERPDPSAPPVASQDVDTSFFNLNDTRIHSARIHSNCSIL